MIDTVLLRPLPFSQPNELVMLSSAPDHGNGRETHSFPDNEDFRAQAKSGLIASYSPARHATAVDPVVALRCE